MWLENNTHTIWEVGHDISDAFLCTLIELHKSEIVQWRIQVLHHIMQQSNNQEVCNKYHTWVSISQ